jgi:hypothetical protein
MPNDRVPRTAARPNKFGADQMLLEEAKSEMPTM